jgi:hypothetical protein
MINYYQMFLETIKNLNGKPKLLLHACCAPCSSACLDVLEEYFDITVYYYNPNISPQTEYKKRLAEEQRFVSEAHSRISVVEGEYDNENFEKLARGLETLAEGGERCKKCYRMRLEKTAKYAKENGFDYFTTTLSISPHKNSTVLNEIGGEVAQQFGVKYLFSDFKKNDGYKKSIELSKKYNLYRQDYCGCKYSKELREKQKAQKGDL